MRLAVYTDYAYHRDEEGIYAERAFALFLGALAGHVDRLVLVGRLSPERGGGRYPLGAGVELVGLPYYAKLSRPAQALPSLVRSLGRFWGALAEVDAVWLLGPHPLAIAFALMALIRRRRVILGVRQDMPAYVRSRHPDRPSLAFAARVLEGAFRALGRMTSVVVVGPELAQNYTRSRRLLEIAVSLISERDLVAPEAALARRYDGELRVLSVGRLEAEKNPLLLADVLHELNGEAPRWRLAICGEGELAGALEARLAELGETDRADLLGYVDFGPQLLELYRGSHVLLHTSWTEGFPAVIPEAFAAGLPAVAADVGGIAAAVGNAALLVPPGDPAAAAQAVSLLAADSGLRERLVRAGHKYAVEHTLEAETLRLAEFLRGI